MSEEILGAGARIAAVRRHRGLALDTLAAQLKVPVARLEALENERWDQLPDATHARALATSVCRVLGLDPAPILATMPRGAGPALERVSQGLNQPVRSGQTVGLPRWSLALLLLVLAGLALTLVLLPRGSTDSLLETVGLPTNAEPTLLPPASEVAASQVAPMASEPVSVPAAASLPAPAASGVASAPAAAPSAPAAPAAATPAPAPASALLEIRASRGASWVSVSDAAGNNLASQLLNQGEVLNLNPQTHLPLRLTLGNAPALELRWRGQAQALEGYEQRRVAKLELK